MSAISLSLLVHPAFLVSYPISLSQAETKIFSAPFDDLDKMALECADNMHQLDLKKAAIQVIPELRYLSDPSTALLPVRNAVPLSVYSPLF